MLKKMNPEVKTLWLSALLSGDFKQGRDYLCLLGETEADNRYCCLGVLCQLAVQNGVPLEVGEDRDAGLRVRSYTDPRNENNPQVFGLPVAVQEWAGLVGSLPHAYPNGWGVSLNAKNDAGFTFEQIAKIIEEGL